MDIKNNNLTTNENKFVQLGFDKNESEEHTNYEHIFLSFALVEALGKPRIFKCSPLSTGTAQRRRIPSTHPAGRVWMYSVSRVFADLPGRMRRARLFLSTRGRQGVGELTKAVPSL